MLALKFKTGAIFLTFGLVFFATQSSRGYANEPHTFIIAAGAGYGVEDCLDEGGECGKAVADAWCESHGRGTAVKFGRSPDVADAISKVASVTRPYFITCGD